MKKAYSRLCLKERWTFFVICLIIGIAAIGFAVYSYVQNQMVMLVLGIICALAMVAIDISVFFMNKRRRAIKREYSHEFDRELFAKERTCPKCGASIGSNVCFCPKCGTKFHS